MTERFLDKVIASTRVRVNASKDAGYFPKLRSRAEANAASRTPNGFASSLRRPGSVNVIAEIKRASPSKGVIRGDIDVAAVARGYAAGGAAAISVLTEPKHFHGSVSDLVTTARTVEVPVLRKDFIVDEYQIVEAGAAGAAAVLLIVAALEKDELRSLLTVAKDVALDALVEVHDLPELDTAASVGAELIGVNNRDLNSLDVSLDTSRRLAAHKPPGSVLVAESGISQRAEIDELRSLGFDAFLVGESVMRQPGLLAELAG